MPTDIRPGRYTLLLALTLASVFSAVTAWNALERQSGPHPAPMQAWPARSDGRFAEPAAIRRVQSGLARLNFYSGSIDGQAGPRTRAAVRRFRSARSLTPGDHIDDALIAELVSTGALTSR